VYLTEDERMAASKKLAETLWERDQKQDEAKSKAAEYRDEVKALSATVSELQTVVRSGVQHRLVDCEDRKNLAAGTIETYRLDTGEMVESRPMSGIEKQADMFPRDNVVVITTESLKGKRGKAE
jgi:hypothetical protein